MYNFKEESLKRMRSPIKPALECFNRGTFGDDKTQAKACDYQLKIRKSTVKTVPTFVMR